MDSVMTNEPVRLPTPRRSVVPTGVLGMLILVIPEVMFFSGLISAYTINKANALPGMWPPPFQPRLPAEATLLNTAALILSGGLLVVAAQRFQKVGQKAFGWFLTAWLLGTAFVALQGREWLALLSQGLTLTSSSLGSYFYMIVGVHGLHAVAALLWMAYALFR